MRRVVRSSVGILCVVAALTGSLGANPGDLAVIVSKENTTEEMAFHDLVKIFKQERQYWEGGAKIYLIMRESGAPEKEILLQKVYRMADDNLKKFWLGKLYRGEITALPKTLGSNEAVKRFVAQAPNAIGVVDAAAVDGSVKVLRIDGRMPGEPGYGLSD